MKRLLPLLLLSLLSQASEVSDTITNQTTKPMLCIGSYPSVYTEKLVDGYKRRVETSPREELISTLQPKKSLKKKREGSLYCFNELEYVKSRQQNDIERSNQYTLKSHVNNHNRYDITRYQGKDRSFVEHNFGIAQSCAPLNGGEYCNHGFGLDIFYDKKQDVNTIFLYGNTVARGTLPFEPVSMLKLRTNASPLGLWVQKHYKELFSKKPDFRSQNVMSWKYPSKGIKRVIVTAKNGHYELSHTFKDGQNLFRSGRNESKTPQDYIQAIEVQYK